MVVLKPDDYVELCLLMIDAIVDQETKNYSWLLLLSKVLTLLIFIIIYLTALYHY